MLKKYLIVLLVLLSSALFSLTLLARRAPTLLKNAIEQSLKTEVSIRSVDYYFPWNFELSGFEVREPREPFRGDPSLVIEDLKLQISPLSLSQRKLIIHKLEATHVRWVVRKWYGRVFHPFFDALRESDHAGLALADRQSLSPAQLHSASLLIRDLKFSGAQFQFLDYDAAENGFVVSFQDGEGELKNIAFPATDGKTSFSAQANVVQGRSEQPARTKFSGWVNLKEKEAEVVCRMTKLHLPYFRPYYRRITQSDVAEGYLDLKSVTRLANRRLSSDLDLEFSNLHFNSYESGELLFNLKAEEILAFLKDSSGKLKLQIPVRWNMAERSMRFTQAIRKGIEQSLKKTILGNFSHAIEGILSKKSASDN